MNEQPEALRLADELDGIPLADMTEALADDAAAELRRLHAVNAELLEALQACEARLTHLAQNSVNVVAELKQARVAIAKAGGEPK